MVVRCARCGKDTHKTENHDLFVSKQPTGAAGKTSRPPKKDKTKKPRPSKTGDGGKKNGDDQQQGGKAAAAKKGLSSSKEKKVRFQKGRE